MNCFKQLDLIKPSARLDVRKYFFAVRCVDRWNELSQSIQEIDDLTEFKKEYDKLAFFKYCVMLYLIPLNSP